MTHRLTGSCAPVILGISPTETPLQLFARLAGRMADQHAGIKATRRAVEPALLAMLCAERGLVGASGSVGCDSSPARAPHEAPISGVAGRVTALWARTPTTDPSTPWLSANPDGWAGDVLLIVKSCLWLTVAELAESPAWLTAIVQHELAATGAQRAAVGVECAGGWFKTGWASADQAFQADLLRAEAAFVDALERGEPPSTKSADDVEAAKRVWSGDDGSEVALGSSAADRWAAIKRLRRIARESEAKAKSLEAKLRAQAGPARTIKLPGGGRLSLATRADSTGRVSRRLVER